MEKTDIKLGVLFVSVLNVGALLMILFIYTVLKLTNQPVDILNYILFELEYFVCTVIVAFIILPIGRYFINKK